MQDGTVFQGSKCPHWGTENYLEWTCNSIEEWCQLERSQGQSPGRNILRTLAFLPPIHSRVFHLIPNDVEEAHWPGPNKQTEVLGKVQLGTFGEVNKFLLPFQHGVTSVC